MPFRHPQYIFASLTSYCRGCLKSHFECGGEGVSVVMGADKEVASDHERPRPDVDVDRFLPTSPPTHQLHPHFLSF